jgi:drug/metabolite transporter (DMT)-like permease
MEINVTLYWIVASITAFIGLIIVGYNVEKDDMDAEVCIPLSLLAIVCGFAWPIVLGIICAFGIGYIPISLGRYVSKNKKKVDFKKKLKETYESPIDKIKKR